MRITTNRALLDWHRRPRSRVSVDAEAGEEANRTLPGIVGMTRFRLVFDLSHARICEALIALCNEAIDSGKLTPPKVAAIRQARAQFHEALTSCHGDENE